MIAMRNFCGRFISARFQEFWTFSAGAINGDAGDRAGGESDLLKEENFVESLTDETLREFTAGRRKSRESGALA